MSIPLIQVTNLSKQYTNDGVVTPVLHDLSFCIPQGEFVAIMGPSGSGKSTLMHILGFLDRPSSGSYRFDDKETTDLIDDELASIRNKKVGFVFQSFNLLPRTSVLDNVVLPLIYDGAKDPTARATNVIDSVGLAHRRHHLSSQLSGGEKQRVAIARALVNRPQVLFADEPTGNLDSKSGGQIMVLLADLHRQGNTIILVTHETYTAEHAERIIRLHDGEIVSDDKVKKRVSAEGELVK